MQNHELTSSERAQVLASRQKVEGELDGLWRELNRIIDDEYADAFNQSEIDCLMRCIEDAQEVVNDCDRILARGR